MSPFERKLRIITGLLAACMLMYAYYGFPPFKHRHQSSIGTRYREMFARRCSARYNASSSVLSWRLATEGEAQNFGDELSEHLFSRMLGFPAPMRHERGKDDNAGPMVLGVGSLGGWARECDTMWGTGVYNMQGVPSTSLLDIRAVRGPWTRRILMTQNPGLYVPSIYGDPGLLVPVYFPEIKPKKSRASEPLFSQVTIILHFKHEGLVLNDSRWDVISARTHDWKLVAQKIADSTFVVSSSLHGLILADAFGVPSRGLQLGCDEPMFKYADYYAGSGRSSFFMASTVEEAMWLGPELPAVFDKQALIRAFPFDRFADS